jgi:hypothetical protein
MSPNATSGESLTNIATTDEVVREAATHHHHIARVITEAHAADTPRTAAHNRPTAPVRPRHRRPAKAAVLIAIGALALHPGALAQPVHDIGTSTNKHATPIAREHHPRATPGTITFTNPLGRTRGPGAGAGLL